MNRRKAVMFANVRSGSARRFPQAVVMLEDAGITVTSVRFALTRDAISDAIDEAREDGVDLVLACGGDGTVGSVVDAIVGKDVTLGIVAAGTSNNFARSLGITPSLRGSVAAIQKARTMTIDVGEVNGLYFAHAAIMGLNVEFAREAQRLRTVVGRFSYPVASMTVYLRRRKLGVRIETGGEQRQMETYQVAIMNSSHYGGPIGLGVPSASIESHFLRILSVSDLRLGTILKGLPTIFFQRHLGLPGAKSFELLEGTLTTSSPVPLTLDGEIRTHTPARVRVVPKALRVIAGTREGKH